jgi:hypothetical protein
MHEIMKMGSFNHASLKFKVRSDERSEWLTRDYP